MTKEQKQTILEESAGDWSYKVSKHLADKHALKVGTVYSLLTRHYKNGLKTQRPSMEKPKLTKHTNPDYLQVGDDVIIVEAYDFQYKGKKGVLASAKPLRVTLSDNTEVSVIKVHKYADTSLEPKRKQKKMTSKYFIRFICDFADNNPHLTYQQIADVFKEAVNYGNVASWMREHKKNRHRWPAYSAKMAEEWTKQYLEPKEAKLDIEDLLAVEELSRQYNFTDGEIIYRIEINTKDKKISLHSYATDQTKEFPIRDPRAIDLTMDIPSAESLMRVIEGSIKMYEELAKVKQNA